MKILLTGATGYIGARLLILLLEAGHHVVAMVRQRSPQLPTHPHLTILCDDLLEAMPREPLPDDIEVAYYLVHAMSYSKQNFAQLEQEAISHFIQRLRATKVKQVIYLSGLCNDRNLSPHLASRYQTELTLRNSGLPYTILRAGIIIGAGSASFEMIRDLAEKLPVMIAPKWVNNLCQPIAIEDVLRYLMDVIGNPQCLNQVFDIGGPEQLTYKQMLLGYARERNLTRYIYVVPVLTPKLSSYWLYFITSVNFSLASSLVDSVKNQAICTDHKILEIFPEPCLSYPESLKKALDIAEQHPLVPSWSDSMIAPALEARFSELAEIPQIGCLVDRQEIESPQSPQEVTQRLWSIGGKNGWYYMDWAWGLRGFLDKLVGGVGLQRGRAYSRELASGSALDFWRVLVADRQQGTLLLYAEMKLPGEAWLEFRIAPTANGTKLIQTASFRPKGVCGRLYWYAMWPFHQFIFRGMARKIALG